MYRVEWMKKGETTLYWDGFALFDVAMRFMQVKKEDASIVMLVMVTPWETMWL